MTGSELPVHGIACIGSYRKKRHARNIPTARCNPASSRSISENSLYSANEARTIDVMP